MKTAKDVAREMAGWFETRKRDEDGAPFVALKKGYPTELGDFIRDEIHNAAGTLPCDWLYEETRAAFHLLSEDDVDDITVEADPYYSDLREWFESYANSADVCDEAAEALGLDPKAGMWERIGLGQVMERERILRCCAEFVGEMIEAGAESDEVQP